MSTFALIGRQLSHSFSKVLFEERFGSEGMRYDLVELESLDGLRDEVERRRLDGFNVTIPYKTNILPLLDAVSDEASRIGAVNTVRVDREGGAMRLAGFNTDAPAFAESIGPMLRPHHRKALILGTGGAARAVAYALETLGLDILFVSRQPAQGSLRGKTVDYATAYALAAERTVIVNATPVGMFPSCSASPWQRPDLLTPRHLCFDLVYNPSPTRFMQEAALRGATTSDGLEMLRLQAQKAWRIWGIEQF